jgi:hypothetical protein
MTPPTNIAHIAGLERLDTPVDPCVYFLCRGDTVVYVGQSVRLAERLKDHRAKVYDTVYFVRCELAEMGALERRWITELRPELNIAGAGKGVTLRRDVRRFRLMERAKAELKSETGIGRQSPSPEAVLQRMHELLLRAKTSVTDSPQEAEPV